MSMYFKLSIFLRMGSGRGHVPAPIRRLAALSSTGIGEPGPSWEYTLAVGVWRAATDRELGCEKSCMAETGIWNGCCVIRIGLPLTDQTGQDFGSRPHEQGLMLVELSPLWLRLWVCLGWELL